MENESKGNATQRTHTHARQSSSNKEGWNVKGREKGSKEPAENWKGRPENQDPGMEDGRAEALAREVKAPWATDSGNLRK